MVLLTIQHRVGDNIIWISTVSGNKFFHPYHIVPLIKFVGTFMKNTDSFITEFFVKANTVVMQMFILMFSVRNTSIYICHALLCENFFELFVEVFCRFRFRDYQGGYKYLFQLTNHTLFCL